ncbi:DNPEP [Bugula neritina]|uniref:Aspartyl aminopeptidase n=1 Tax=Bugula neritina TaxID=10212 RepID=A0A7J7KL13_BUGNE|nr:DNPEP [Bugula neritina]
MASRHLITSTAQGMVDFINKSPSPWHAVHECKKALLAAGYLELKETDKWDIKPMSKYFVTRNMSTIISFAVGGAYKPGNGFSLMGAHTDSPCIRVKPVSKKENAGYLQVGVELYGGGNWLTWFDRDLRLAGRAIVKEKGHLINRLVHVNRPLMRIPSIAIHLQRDINTNFSPNSENEICPVIATAFQNQLVEQKDVGNGIQSDKHHPLLLNLIAEELGVAAADISDFELCLADYQPANLGGALDEFVFAPRLDNLFNVYTALQAMISFTDEDLASDPCIRVAGFFDHEEVGSTSAQGANSNFQRFILQRLCAGGEDETSFQRSMANSYMVSEDIIAVYYQRRSGTRRQPQLQDETRGEPQRGDAQGDSSQVQHQPEVHHQLLDCLRLTGDRE